MGCLQQYCTRNVFGENAYALGAVFFVLKGKSIQTQLVLVLIDTAIRAGP